MAEKSKKRIRATNRILELMRGFDKITKSSDPRDIPNFNEKYYKDFLNKMTDAEFTNYMRKMQKGEEILRIDVNLSGVTEYELSKMFDLAEQVGVECFEDVVFPHLNPKDPTRPTISSTPHMVGYLSIRKLQQMLDKKNTATADNDSYNPITGQVTGESKSSSLSDAQTFALTATGQIDSIKEFLGPRADDFEAKMIMARDIETKGETSLKDMKMRAKNKQSLQTIDVFLKGAGFTTDILKDNNDRAMDIEDLKK